MILSDKDIKRNMEAGFIDIRPLKKEQIEPASVDLRLGNSFSLIKKENEIIKFNQKTEYEELILEKDEKFVLKPHQFVLATTKESVRLDGKIAAFVEGRSSIGRLGLFIENAGWVDNGFWGQITLELYNSNEIPIELTPGTRICQLVFAETKNVPDNLYNGKYNGQNGATGSMSFRDREFVKNG
jgi:dCTP deaminase